MRDCCNLGNILLRLDQLTDDNQPFLGGKQGSTGK
jgi:hypothetical protein